MKHILVTAATEAEIQPFTRFLQAHYAQPTPGNFVEDKLSITIHISGVGMMATAFSLGNCFARHTFDAAVQAGIAGAFDTNLPLGSVVGIASETYGDLGAEDKEAYIDIFELGFLQRDAFPFAGGTLPNSQPWGPFGHLPMVSSLSVNTVSGSAPTIAARMARHPCTVENMEGIAFHYACLQQGIPFIQVRAISNYVSPRDRSAWQIGPAIENLNHCLQQTFTNILLEQA